MKASERQPVWGGLLTSSCQRGRARGGCGCLGQTLGRALVHSSSCFFWFLRAPRRASSGTAFPWRFSRLFKLFSGAEEASSVEILIGQPDHRDVLSHLISVKVIQSCFHVVCLIFFFFFLTGAKEWNTTNSWFRQTKAPYHKFKSVMRPAVKNLEFK